jgi:hypothetical protein
MDGGIDVRSGVDRMRACGPATPLNEAAIMDDRKN